MTNKTFKSTIAALALVVLATSGGTASAGVASITLGNLSTAAIEAGESKTASTKVGYRRRHGHGHNHGYRRHNRWGHGYGHRRCQVKKRFWDSYTYSYYYRWVNVCRY